MPYKTWRERHKKKCLDCSNLIHYSSLRCVKCSAIYYRGGKQIPNSFQKGHILSEEIKRKIGLANGGKKKPPRTLEHRKNLSLSLKGEKNRWWKGGIYPIHKAIRCSFEYRLWREAIFKRDNWTCLWCKQKGGKLNADHIKSFALYPELRFAIDNGRTLCEKCHQTTDNYGSKWIKT